MAANRKSFSMDHPVVILFVVIAVVAAMGLAAEVLKPLALAILLAFALTPLCRLFERRGLPRAASAVLTVVLVLGALSGISYVVAGQLDSLAGDLADPQRRSLIDEKLRFFRSGPRSNLAKVQDTIRDVTKEMDPGDSSRIERRPATGEEKANEKAGRDEAPLAGDKTITGEKIQKVQVVEQPQFRERLESAVGPFLEALTLGSFILILVLFMLVTRDDLADRVIALFGGRQISTTTRTMHEMGDRIGRFLATNAIVNACFGVVIGVGVWLIGLPYGALWGVLAALLRFVPYVGTVIAFSLPTIYAVASFPGWGHALAVVALFLVIETMLNSFLEPIIYGKTTGVSALGLLVAAMFWTWLWGVWGLLLSTPMTVALAVMGKYVPALGFFSTVLGEESELEPDIRFYQRLLALDEDGATDIVEEVAKSRPRVEVFEQVLLPALARAERDFAREEIDDRIQAFVWRVTDELLDELQDVPMLEFGQAAADGAAPPAEPIEVVGVPVEDKSDALALRMLGQLLDPKLCRMTIRERDGSESPLALADAIAASEASLVVISHVPPSGLASASYLTRRLHARLTHTPILAARWTEKGETESASKRLTAAGATSVAFCLSDARDRILAAAGVKKADAAPLAAPALA